MCSTVPHEAAVQDQHERASTDGDDQNEWEAHGRNDEEPHIAIIIAIMPIIEPSPPWGSGLL